MVEALRFTSGVSNRSNTRVTFKKIHNARFTIAHTQRSPRNASNPTPLTLTDACVVTV
jgi:hypothetical protein